MIYKIFMLIASIASMLGASVFPAGPTAEVLEEAIEPSGTIAMERLVTRGNGGTEFGRVSLVWAEMNGRRVEEDVWGTGNLDSIVFQVGLRAADGRTLTLGDRSIPLKPTDVITIRDFQGRFAIAGANSQEMTLALDGHVKTTTFRDGRVKAVHTDASSDTSQSPVNAPGGGTQTNGPQRMAYVVLGDKTVDTLTVDTSLGQPLATKDLTTETPANATEQAMSILTRWVKLDGELVREYRWGEGRVKSIQFAVADNAGDVRLVFNGKDTPLRPGQVVEVKEFLGAYVLFQVQNGFKLKLDGYAESMSSAGLNPTEPVTGNLEPRARFGWTPEFPTTSDSVQFVDYSTDDDGFIVLRAWNFGDGPVASYPQVDGVAPDAPRHRYSRAGTYQVTLTVTDNNLATDILVQNITIMNTPPVAAYDWAPKRPASFEPIQFFDKSWDVDGRIVRWVWDFGDGSMPVEGRDPKHAYGESGRFNVTLSVTDSDGGVATVSKVVRVYNLPPVASFSWEPDMPQAGTPVQLIDESTDPDGEVSSWRWEVATDPPILNTSRNPIIEFPVSGTFRVKLTVTDNDGGTNTAFRDITIANRAPIAEWRIASPQAPVTLDPVQFEDLSYDPDGRVLSWQWSFGDGRTSTLPNPIHRFPANDTYLVRLTVTDNLGAKDWLERSVTIGNAPPNASFVYQPTNPFTSTTILFTDTSKDRDGDLTIGSWAWDFADGNSSTSQHATWAFTRSGIYEVALTVTDDHDNSAMVRRPVNVLNRPPQVTFTVDPARPVANEPVRFIPTASDPDGTVVSYNWDFQEAASGMESPTYSFTRAGLFLVTLVVVDNDGDSASFTREVIVLHAPPVANFTWTPTMPTAGVPVQFSDLSVASEGNLVAWSWSFGDSAQSSQRNPTHTYSQPGEYTVRLLTEDSSGATASTSATLRVNAPPIASFENSPRIPLMRQPVTFSSTAVDPDGTVETYRWEIGNLTFFGATFEYTFTEPGSYLVRHTVVDNDGGVSTVSRTFTLRNLRPVAAFESESWPIQNIPVGFLDQSTDADGHIVNWTYQFGDGGVSYLQTPLHAFEENGRYRVILTVRDNDGDSSFMARTIRVASDFDVVTAFRVLYPDGSPVNVSRSHVFLELTTSNGTRIVKNDLDLTRGDEGIVLARLPAGTWAGQDVVTLTGRMTGLATGLSQSVALTLNRSSALQDALNPLVLNLGLTASVTMEPAATHASVDFRNPDWPYAVYSNPMEPVYFRVNLTWRDGTPVRGVTIHPQVEYNPLWGGLLDGALFQSLTQSIAPNETDENGEQRFMVPFRARAPVPLFLDPSQDPPVGTSTETQGAYIPGAYRVVARVTFADQSASASARFYQDPFGVMTGILHMTP